MLDSVLGFKRSTKRVILTCFDTVMVPLALYCAFCMRFGTPFPFEQVSASGILFVLLTLTAPVVLWLLAVPHIKLGAFGFDGIARIGAAAGVLLVTAMVFSFLLQLSAPRSVPLIFGAFFFLFAVLGRLVALWLLTWQSGQRAAKPVVIYGAGAAGIQLASALRQSEEVHPVAYVDDNSGLHGTIISGLKVHAPEELPALMRRRGVQRVLVAIPSLRRADQQALVRSLEGMQFDVQVMPSYVDIISGREAELRTVSPDALLGRDKVDLKVPEIAKAYSGRTVLVSGAGGSIGSELCRQLLECRPARIILFEHNEFSLYEIDMELRPQAIGQGIEVVARLGSVTNKQRVMQVLAEEEVDIILHAAAYKHVPLVEDNELEGARNNVVGTAIMAEAAAEQNVERFILVSTDKAVRPTNIMGATKRMAEMVVQQTQQRSTRTRFSIVRFGNVLGSSGSVLPLFERQIRAGGPVTVTHPEVTRFFMTIPEAARLVLLAGTYAENADVFVLDMGKPKKIIDIAHRMIEMSGAHVRSDDRPGGIEVRITGLRPGEKLYEELLTADASLVKTPHPKILRAQEDQPSEFESVRMMKALSDAIRDGNRTLVRKTAAEFVSGYHVQKVVS